ncbi:MAG: DUF1579 family protein [candidate division Zixibacteria bacterium]|nr:DUF1579 family protein [candidate division Zixibacteria bacterium]
MKARWSVMVLMMALVAVCAIVAVADDVPAQGEGGMPPMGPPEEIKNAAKIIGTWDVATKMKMDTAQVEWMEAPAVVTFSYFLDGGAIRMDYEMEMMGMPFKGFSISTYDRETKQWQEVWVDNMSCRLSMMTGTEENGVRIMTGTDIWQGQEMLTKNTSYNFTDTSFDWTMESSVDGGKTWFTGMTATYTKRK